MIAMPEGPFSIGSTVWPGTSRVLEEIGELGQVLGKLIGAGGETAHYDGTDLRARLVDEVADVRAALDFLVKHNELPAEYLNVRRTRKLAQYERWHAVGLAAQEAPAPLDGRPSDADDYGRDYEAQAHAFGVPEPGDVGEPSAPRVWREGDPEPPDDVTLLLVEPGAPGAPYLKRAPAGGWWFVQSSGDETDPEGWGWAFAFATEDPEVTALTEVPSDSVRAALGEGGETDG